ncbi:MAG: mechanosensitive ion channel [Flavobacteriales bacterium]|nr:mechanosensitive ion channel [Flavobacteriales bacterium]MCB9168131.1 mechanosensitive ion channel [Flavobacteriales bacterium]
MLKVTEAVELIQQKLLSWTKDFVQMLPNLAVAAMIVVVGWMAARLARLLVRKLLGRWPIGPTLLRLVGNSIYLAVLLVGVFTALSVVHLDKTVTSILAGAGIIGLALGFAFQDLAANFVSGIFMAVQRPLRVGDLVETGGHFGVVQRIDLRTTEITNMQGLQVIIPNKEVFQGVLVNYTHNRIRRVDLEVGISYGEDLARAQRVTLDAVRGVEGLLPDQPLELFYTAFGDSSIDFELRFWVRAKDQSDFQAHQSAAIMAIKAAYNKEGITIPFPIRTLDFGIKGGEKLDAMWPKKAGDGHGA